MSKYDSALYILFYCIPQRTKTFSVVSHNGKKPLPLYPTIEESFFHCFPQRKKNSSIVSHNRGKYLLLWDTTKENLRRCGIQCWRFFWDTVHYIRFCCGVGYNGRKISCVVGYNRKKFVCHSEIVLHCIPQWKKSSSVVSHNGGKPSLLYTTAEKKLFRCIIQRKKTSFVAYHNGKRM